jgi:glycosyltransferase involved in cell wall biosynthesis
MRPLHVGVDLTFLRDHAGGMGRYALELIPALLSVEPGLRLTAFVSRDLPSDVRAQPWAGALRWTRLPVTMASRLPGAFARVTAAQWVAIPALAELRRMDVVHGVANVTSLWAPGVARVVTLHDVIWLKHPYAMERAATVGMRRVALPSARRADRVIAVSAAAKADIVEAIGIDASRVDVVHHGVRHGHAAATPAAELRVRLALGDGPVLLCVAQKRSHKNLEGLVRAFAALGDDGSVLVLPGDPTPHEGELRALAAELGVGDRLRLPAWVSEADLEGLYAAAACFVLPSFVEGFGLPVLEAMRRGVAVACSRGSALGEVAGDAAELFDPRDVGSITAALRRILGDEAHRRDLARRGRERAASFTWEATARGTLATYGRALASRRR